MTAPHGILGIAHSELMFDLVMLKFLQNIPCGDSISVPTYDTVFADGLQCFVIFSNSLELLFSIGLETSSRSVIVLVAAKWCFFGT